MRNTVHLLTLLVAEIVVNERSQGNVISDGAIRFEADVEQSATEIQVSPHKKLFRFSLWSHLSLYGLFVKKVFSALPFSCSLLLRIPVALYRNRIHEVYTRHFYGFM